MNTVVPHAVSDLELVARAIAGSKLFGIQTPEQALALCFIAQAEGKHPATAAQDYSIIQGRPSKRAEAMLRDFLASGGKVQWHRLDDEAADATFSHPAGGAARIEWTMARAQQAGLRNQQYQRYPRQMLRSRTVSEGVRTVCPMATSGMYVPEEVAEFEPVKANGHAATEALAIEDHRILNPDTGRLVNPKSAHQAKKAGLDKRHDALRHEITDLTAVTDCIAWGVAHKAEIETFPDQWRDMLREDLARHMADLRAIAAQADGADPETGEIEDDDPDGFPGTRRESLEA
jgi:hypothetical protein